MRCNPQPRITWEDRLREEGFVLGDRTGYRAEPRPTPRETFLPTRPPTPASTGTRACPSEDDEQRSLFVWRDTVLALEPRLDLLHHIPNGKHRTKAVAGQLKALGVKRHIPDVFLPVPRHGFHGFWDELKALDGTVPPAQKTLHARLREHGYFVAVSFGWVEAARELCRYLDRADLAKQLGET